MAEALRTDPLQLEPLVDLLTALDWVARLDEGGEARHVLLCDPAKTPLAPLIERTLLEHGTASAAFRAAARLDRLTLAEAVRTGSSPSRCPCT